VSSFSVALLGIAHVHVGDHLDVIEADPGLRLTAVWDPDQERARSLEPELVVADPVTAATGADIVVVDSVTSAHFELVPVAAAAGKAVFVEKPLGAQRRRSSSARRGDRSSRGSLRHRLLPALPAGLAAGASALAGGPAGPIGLGSCPVLASGARRRGVRRADGVDARSRRGRDGRLR